MKNSAEFTFKNLNHSEERFGTTNTKLQKHEY